MFPRFLAVLVLAIVSGGLAASPLHAETLSLREALQRAVEGNPGLRAASLEADARVSEQRSVRGRFLPSVRAGANALYWDDDASSRMNLTAITDILADMAPMLPASTQARLAGLKDDPPTIHLRDRFTYRATVTIAQPLTGLFGIYFNHVAAGQTAQAASHDWKAARLQLQMEVARTYYGLLAAMGMEEALDVALTQIEAYRAQAGAFLEAGRIEPNAVTQVDVQRGELMRALFAAQKGIALGKARLNMLMGRSQDTGFEPERMGAADSAASTAPVGEEPGDVLGLIDGLVAKRPDILAARQMAGASRSGRHAAISLMLPEIGAVFTYEHNGGMGTIQPENQYFVGLTLNWNVWEWGASYFQVRASQAREHGAVLRLDALQDLAQLEIRSRAMDVDEARRGHEVVVLERSQAAENLAIETARYEAGRASTTDLLGAQSLDVRAANDLVLAEMRLQESRLALRAAAGRDLLD
jgi:outer membrane protein TolC